MKKRSALTSAARRVKLLITDVDGVLTDGQIVLSSNGSKIKNFNVYDGFGMVLARQAGLKTAIITAEESAVVSLRARLLHIDWVIQSARDKAQALTKCLKHFKLPANQAAFIGDDILDLPALTRVGFSAAVANAHPEVKRRVGYITKASGGDGAVREFIEFILKAQGHWPKLLKEYTG